MGCLQPNISVSGLEWAAVSAYLQWLEVQAELVPFSISKALSFHVGPTGFEGLVSSKRSLSYLLATNLKNLEEWAKLNGDGMDEFEKVFVRSLWLTTKDVLETVQEYIARAIALEEATKSFENVLDREDITDDEIPF